jgi:hypothetical protein
VPPGFQVFNVVGSEPGRARFEVGVAERELGFAVEARFESYPA